MTWQDGTLAVINLWFIVGLIPSVRHPTQKPTMFTSLSTGVGCWAMAFTLSTLGQVFGPLVIAILGCEWILLGWQGFKLQNTLNRKRK